MSNNQQKVIASTRTTSILDASEYHILTEKEHNVENLLKLFACLLSLAISVAVGAFVGNSFATLTTMMIVWAVSHVTVGYSYARYLLAKHQVNYLSYF